MGQALNKTNGAVSKKMARLGLERGDKPQFISREVEKIRELTGRIKMEDFYNLNINKGDRIKINVRNGFKTNNRNPIQTFEGEVIFKSDRIITIKGKNYNESFILSDFYIGKAVIV